MSSFRIYGYLLSDTLFDVVTNDTHYALQLLMFVSNNCQFVCFSMFKLCLAVSLLLVTSVSAAGAVFIYQLL